MFREYRAYIADNPEGYWFKRKLYGWGWTPARFQGWVVVVLYVTALVWIAPGVENESTFQEMFVSFFLPLIVLTALLIFICYRTGEKPRWQWGIPKDSDKKS